MLDMDEGAKRWLFKTAHQNFWRVASWMDLDDLVQDGYWHYYRLTNKYPQVVDRPHIMSLFKITYINYLHDLSKSKTRQLDVPECDLASPQEPDSSHILDSYAGCDHIDHTLCAMVAQAPEPIKALFRALATDEGCRRFAMPYRRRGTHRETLNDRLCRIAGSAAKEFRRGFETDWTMNENRPQPAGYDPANIDLVTLLQGYFSERTGQRA